MGTYIKVRTTGAPFKFKGPDCTLMLLVCGSEIVHPQRGEIKVFFPAAKAANDSAARHDGTRYLLEPMNDTFVQMGAPHLNWATAENRFHAGFEVPDYILKDPRVPAILSCLRRAPGALVTDSPFPELIAPDPTLSPWPPMKRSPSDGETAPPF